MAYLEPKLVTKLAQKQVLTPGLVQMVSLLTLNKLELTEMIQQELVQNPVLEEGTEIFEKPSFENFLAKPPSLTDHLEWQLGLATVEENIRLACHSIIGNLNEDGYLCAVDENGREVPITLEEIAESGEHTLEEVQQALEVVQRFDPPGVAARDLRECLMIQLRILEEDDTIVAEVVADHLHKLQNKQFKEIAKALNRPLNVIMETVEIIQQLDPRPGQKHNRTQPRLIEPDVFIVKVGGQYTVVTNEDEVPQL